MSRDANKQSDKLEAIAKLRTMVKPGDTIWTSLRHVSRSGMSRSISLHITDADGIFDISWLAARACDSKMDRDRGGVKIGGCGMDMGFALVYDLSYQLFKDGFVCIGEKCPANDHSNGDRDYTPHPHKDAGYALRHKWL